jgi:hypothetical protein
MRLLGSASLLMWPTAALQRPAHPNASADIRSAGWKRDADAIFNSEDCTMKSQGCIAGPWVLRGRKSMLNIEIGPSEAVLVASEIVSVACRVDQPHRCGLWIHGARFGQCGKECRISRERLLKRSSRDPRERQLLGRCRDKWCRLFSRQIAPVACIDRILKPSFVTSEVFQRCASLLFGRLDVRHPLGRATVLTREANTRNVRVGAEHPFSGRPAPRNGAICISSCGSTARGPVPHVQGESLKGTGGLPEGLFNPRAQILEQDLCVNVNAYSGVTMRTTVPRADEARQVLSIFIDYFRLRGVSIAYEIPVRPSAEGEIAIAALLERARDAIPSPDSTTHREESAS